MLWLFSLAVLALLLSPGPNMMFVLSHGVAHGSRAGVAAALGMCAADLVMTLLAATGTTAIITAWPPSFDVLRIVGAVYLLWIVVQKLCSVGKPAIENCRSTSLLHVSRMAMLNSLFNPKALLFFILILPQFVVPAQGNIPLQLIVLGCVAAVEALAFHIVLGLFSGRIGAYLNQRPRFAIYQSRIFAAVLVTLALRLLLLERPATR